MKTTVKMVAGTALAVSAVAAGSVTANAASPTDGGVSSSPGAISVQIAPGVQYTGNVATNSAQIVTPIGTLTTAGNQFAVRDDHGRSVWGNPAIAAISAPPADRWSAATAGTGVTTAEIAGQQAENGGEAYEASASATAPAAPVDAPVAPADPMTDFEAALGVAATNFGAASGVGAMVGGVVGAAIGCPLGIVTGGTLLAPTVVGTPLGMIGGCLIGAGTVGGVGAIVGGAAIGIPVAVASGVQMYNTLHAQGHI